MSDVGKKQTNGWQVTNDPCHLTIPFFLNPPSHFPIKKKNGLWLLDIASHQKFESTAAVPPFCFFSSRCQLSSSSTSTLISIYKRPNTQKEREMLRLILTSRCIVSSHWHIDRCPDDAMCNPLYIITASPIQRQQQRLNAQQQRMRDETSVRMGGKINGTAYPDPYCKRSLF